MENSNARDVVLVTSADGKTVARTSTCIIYDVHDEKSRQGYVLRVIVRIETSARRFGPAQLYRLAFRLPTMQPLI